MRKQTATRILKVEIKRIRLGERQMQVFVVNDISKFRQNERSKMKHNFSKQLTASLCHEISTPLNSIINISDFLLFNLEKDDPAEAQHEIEMLVQLQSSSKFMFYMLSSQTSCVKHGLKQLVLKLEPNVLPIVDMLVEFLKPYLP